MIPSPDLRADADPVRLWTAIGANYMVLHPDDDRPPLFGSKFMRTLIPKDAKEPLDLFASVLRRDPGEMMDGIASWLVELSFMDGQTGPLAVENGIEFLIDSQSEGGTIVQDRN